MKRILDNSVNVYKFSFIKKLFCIFIIVALAGMFIPGLSAQAFADDSVSIDQNNSDIYGTEAYWQSQNVLPVVIDSIKPGQVFHTGTYLINRPIVVDKPQPGQNGFEIKGEVTFVLVNNGKSSITVEGGDAHGMTGAGAGIYLPHDNIFHVKGVGVLCVEGGKGTYGEEGKKGCDASYKYDFICTDFVSGAGGDGGSGGGGAGAAIGTKGADGTSGGKGGESIKEDEEFKFDHYGNPGQNGESNNNWSEEAGIFKLSGNVDLYAGGGMSEGRVNQAGYGNYVTCFDGHIKCYAAGAGGGGAAGGAGAPGANIGSGGTGGAGGGGGGAGGTAWAAGGISTQYFYLPNAGGGGAGGGYNDYCYKGGNANPECGLFKMPALQGKDSKANGLGGEGGKGAQGGSEYTDAAGGDGANGGTVTARSGFGGCVLWTKDSSLPGLQELEGKEAQHIQVYPVDECEVQIDWEASTDEHFENEYFYYTGKEIKPVPMLIHKPTGKVIKMDSGAFEVSYSDNVNVGDKAMIKLSGTDFSWDHPTICDKNITVGKGESTAITTYFEIRNK